ncbi:MAG: hypothetical protein VST68_08575 [Nitrospirota bacterium]|nr:hypothetical protein [Nitrospirota bacterium]
MNTLKMPFTIHSSHEPQRAIGDVQKSALGQAAGALVRGAYGPVRERERREERQICEPEGQEKCRERR